MNAFCVAKAAVVRVGLMSKLLVVPAVILGAWIMLTAYVYASVGLLRGSIYKVLSHASAASMDCSRPTCVTWEANHLELEEARTSGRGAALHLSRFAPTRGLAIEANFGCSFPVPSDLSHMEHFLTRTTLELP